MENHTYTPEELTIGDIASKSALQMAYLVDVRAGKDDCLALSILAIATYQTLARRQALGGFSVRKGLSHFCELMEHIISENNHTPTPPQLLN